MFLSLIKRREGERERERKKRQGTVHDLQPLIRSDPFFRYLEEKGAGLGLGSRLELELGVRVKR